jgi:hypothetical protein
MTSQVIDRGFPAVHSVRMNLDRFACVALWLAGALHLLPALGLAGAGRLSALYGIDIADPSVLLMLRHRALMFGLLGALMVLAGFVPAWRTGMLAVALASTAGFALLALPGGITPALQRVAWIDAGLVLLLAAALAGQAWKRWPG